MSVPVGTCMEKRGAFDVTRFDGMSRRDALCLDQVSEPARLDKSKHSKMQCAAQFIAVMDRDHWVHAIGDNLIVKITYIWEELTKPDWSELRRTWVLLTVVTLITDAQTHD